MNSLSWMIYLAGVVDSLRGALTLYFIVLAVIVCIFAIFAPLMADEIDDDWFPTIKKIGKSVAVLTACAAAVWVFTPSQNTVYAIAASELGEKVLQTSTASKAQRALDAWLDKQIGDEKPEKQQ